MRKLLFYIFWILIALALPYSIKAETTTSLDAHSVSRVAGTVR